MHENGTLKRELRTALRAASLHALYLRAHRTLTCTPVFTPLYSILRVLHHLTRAFTPGVKTLARASARCTCGLRATAHLHRRCCAHARFYRARVIKGVHAYALCVRTSLLRQEGGWLAATPSFARTYRRSICGAFCARLLSSMAYALRRFAWHHSFDRT